MRAAALALALVLFGGCDPFVVEVDEPSVCGVATGQTFTLREGGVRALIPVAASTGALGLPTDLQGSAQLISVTLTPRGDAALGQVSAARVRVLPSADVAPTVAGVVASSSTSPELADGSLSITGNDTDIFPVLSGGNAQLEVELDGPESALTADVGICLRVDASAHYH